MSRYKVFICVPLIPRDNAISGPSRYSPWVHTSCASANLDMHTRFRYMDTRRGYSCIVACVTVHTTTAASQPLLEGGFENSGNGAKARIHFHSRTHTLLGGERGTKSESTCSLLYIYTILWANPLLYSWLSIASYQ